MSETNKLFNRKDIKNKNVSGINVQNKSKTPSELNLDPNLSGSVPKVMPSRSNDVRKESEIKLDQKPSESVQEVMGRTKNDTVSLLSLNKLSIRPQNSPSENVSIKGSTKTKNMSDFNDKNTSKKSRGTNLDRLLSDSDLETMSDTNTDLNKESKTESDDKLSKSVLKMMPSAKNLRAKDISTTSLKTGNDLNMENTNLFDFGELFTSHSMFSSSESSTQLPNKSNVENKLPTQSSKSFPTNHLKNEDIREIFREDVPNNFSQQSSGTQSQQSSGTQSEDVPMEFKIVSSKPFSMETVWWITALETKRKSKSEVRSKYFGYLWRHSQKTPIAISSKIFTQILCVLLSFTYTLTAISNDYLSWYTLGYSLLLILNICMDEIGKCIKKGCLLIFGQSQIYYLFIIYGYELPTVTLCIFLFYSKIRILNSILFHLSQLRVYIVIIAVVIDFRGMGKNYKTFFLCNLITIFCIQSILAYFYLLVSINYEDDD